MVPSRGLGHDAVRFVRAIEHTRIDDMKGTLSSAESRGWEGQTEYWPWDVGIKDDGKCELRMIWGIRYLKMGMWRSWRSWRSWRRGCDVRGKRLDEAPAGGSHDG